MKKEYKVKNINISKLKTYLKSKPKKNERNTRQRTSSCSKR
jgi:hypothetical protein